MIEDFRLGLRMLRRRRRPAVLTITVLALGIGLATSMWSLLDGVLLRGLPFPDGDRIVLVSTGASYDRPTPAEDFRALREHPQVFEDIAAFRTYNSVMTQPERGSKGFTATYVTGNLFSMLGVEPVLGRNFTLADEDPTSPSVALLSHRVWQAQFGGDPEILGRSIVLNREPMTIVGVMPPGFHFPIRQEAWAAWRPSGRTWSDAPAFVVAALHPGQSPARATLDLAPQVAKLDATSPLAEPRQTHVRGFVDAMVPEATQRSLQILLAAAFGVLLIACANVANLRLGDALARRRELKVRRALGAGRWRLLCQLVAETAVLAAGGAAFGLAVAAILIRLVSTALLDGSLLAHQFWIDVRLDVRAAVFAVAMAILTVLISGLMPAGWSLRRDARLTAHGRGTVGARRETRLALGLISAEVAICFALVLGAGLLARSGLSLVSASPAFDENGLMRTIVNTFQGTAETPAEREAFWSRLLSAVEADPVIAGATLSNSVPWRQDSTWVGIRVDPADDRPTSELPQAHAAQVVPGFFATLDWPLVQGRELERQDILARITGSSAELATVVSASFARRHFDGSAVGRTFAIELAYRGDIRAVQFAIVGVVADRGLGRTDQPLSEDLIFTPYSFQSGGAFLIARGRGDRPMAAIDREVAQLDPLVATLDERTYAAERAQETWVERRLAQLLILLAVTSLVLSAVGLYGVITLALHRRRKELAIRSALGALPRALRAVLLGQGGRSVGLGLVAGGVLAGWSVQFLERFLYQVEPWDARVVGGALLVVSVAAFVALLGPAISAGRTDPAKILRSE